MTYTTDSQKCHTDTMPERVGNKTKGTKNFIRLPPIVRLELFQLWKITFTKMWQILDRIWQYIQNNLVWHNLPDFWKMGSYVKAAKFSWGFKGRSVCFIRNWPIIEADCLGTYQRNSAEIWLKSKNSTTLQSS